MPRRCNFKGRSKPVKKSGRYLPTTRGPVNSQTNRYRQVYQDVQAYLEANPGANKEQLLCDVIEKGCSPGDLTIIKELLDRGANKNGRDVNGIPVLYLAADEGRPDIVRELLSRGADPNLTHPGSEEVESGNTPLHTAALNQRCDHEDCNCGRESDYLEIVNALLESGADINKRTDRGHTPLLSASGSGSLAAVKELLDRGAEVNLTDYEGHTALTYAVQEGWLKVVKCLLEKGARVNCKTCRGYTPLIIGASKGHLKIVTELLKNGADEKIAMRLPCGASCTPFEIAVRAGHREVALAIQMLRPAPQRTGCIYEQINAHSEPNNNSCLIS